MRRMAVTPAGFAEVQSAELRRAFSALLRLRLIMFPVVLGVTLWYWHEQGGSLRQLALIGALFASAAVYLAYLVRHQRHPISTRIAGSGFVVGVLVISGASALTGGLDSPFVILIPAITAMGMLGSDRNQIWVCAVLAVAGVGLLAIVGGSRPLFTLGMLAFGLLVGISVGLTIRGMFERLLLRALKARDELLRMHSEQLHALTVFSSEIAHELKTPLASIKGLTGLAMIELDNPARAAERLEVLRNEALRMQRMLEDFLDFSRPLSPLSPEAADGLQIAEEVIDLFQGLARERRLTLRVVGAPVEVRCDPAKVKQVLINLVQNAVEASRSGAEIAIELMPLPSGVAFRVLDSGHGLSQEVAERVFQAGVTTKPRGSGLGLTIARSIARQHGGTLSLRPREGGGCVAELTLPTDAASAETGRAA